MEAARAPRRGRRARPARGRADDGPDDPLPEIMQAAVDDVPARSRSRCSAGRGGRLGRRGVDRRTRARTRPRTRPRPPTLPDDDVLAYVGPHLTGRRPPGVERVRRPARRRAGDAGAARGRRRRGRARRGRRVAHRAPARGLARPAHAARVDQGLGHDPPRRRSPPRRRDACTNCTRRSTRRSTASASS